MRRTSLPLVFLLSCWAYPILSSISCVIGTEIVSDDVLVALEEWGAMDVPNILASDGDFPDVTSDTRNREEFALHGQSTESEQEEYYDYATDDTNGNDNTEMTRFSSQDFEDISMEEEGLYKDNLDYEELRVEGNAHTFDYSNGQEDVGSDGDDPSFGSWSGEDELGGIDLLGQAFNQVAEEKDCGSLNEDEIKLAGLAVTTSEIDLESNIHDEKYDLDEGVVEEQEDFEGDEFREFDIDGDMSVAGQAFIPKKEGVDLQDDTDHELSEEQQAAELENNEEVQELDSTNDVSGFGSAEDSFQNSIHIEDDFDEEEGWGELYDNGGLEKKKYEQTEDILDEEESLGDGYGDESLEESYEELDEDSMRMSRKTATFMASNGIESERNNDDIDVEVGGKVGNVDHWSNSVENSGVSFEEELVDVEADLGEADRNDLFRVGLEFGTEKISRDDYFAESDQSGSSTEDAHVNEAGRSDQGPLNRWDESRIVTEDVEDEAFDFDDSDLGELDWTDHQFEKDNDSENAAEDEQNSEVPIHGQALFSGQARALPPYLLEVEEYGRGLDLGFSEEDLMLSGQSVQVPGGGDTDVDLDYESLESRSRVALGNLYRRRQAFAFKLLQESLEALEI